VIYNLINKDQKSDTPLFFVVLSLLALVVAVALLILIR